MLRKNHIGKIITLLLMLILPVHIFAQDLNVKEVVLEHISDSYHWHITKWGERDIRIPLPVVVKSKQNGWQVFLSSRLEHGAEYRSLRIAQEGRYAGKIVERSHTGTDIRPIDISITKNAAALMINCMVLLLVILPLARWYKRGSMRPAKGFRGVVEMLLTDIQEEVIKSCVGEDYKRYSPYLLTVFFFILVNNLMGLIPFFPGGATVTGNIAITLVLALCTFFIVNISGTRAYWKEIFWPDIPIWLKVPVPLMPALEFIGIFTKSFALMIRLFANNLAGHSVILGLLCLIFLSATMGTVVNIGMSTLSVIFTCFMTLLELLIAYLQAYIFTLLSAVFIGMARAKHQAHAH